MKNKLLWGILGLFLSLIMVGNIWSQEVLTSEISDYETLNASIMRPDIDTLFKWIKEYEGAPRAFIDDEINRRMMGLQAQGFGTSLSLLSHLQYTPTERSQGTCGNCWNWASTGVLEIAHSVQNAVQDRLSTQYLNSCKTDKYACCGGSLEMYADWYRGGFAVPWSNTNAFFQDGSSQCQTGNESSSVSCNSISTNPNYPITSIQPVTVSTTGVGQSTAIANIKNVLNQNKAIYFGFFLPNQSDWDQFQSFWSGSGASENNIWNPDFSCGHQWVDGQGGGHAVLLVGYNDDDPNNPYWIFLNSWATANGSRPNGLFHMAMNVNYDCTYPVGYQYVGALEWQTLAVEFGGGGGCTYSINPTSQSFTTSGGSGTVTVTTSSGCIWNATSNTGWITITSGSSGNGNGTVNYTVPANTGFQRTGSMTIAGKTFTVTQEGTSVATNLLKNPGFESGSDGNWTEYGSEIIWENSIESHSGNWLAWLGGYNYATDHIYQNVSIPSSSTQAYVQFWYKIGTDETESTVYDTMAVQIRRPSDNALLTTLATLSNLNKTTGWVQSAQYDVSSFKGQTIRLGFYTATDSNLITDFFVDDTSLTVGQGATGPSNRCDFNGDGKTDILWRNKSTGQNVVWLMNGATYSDYAYINSVTDLNWEIVGTGDFNSDGKTDILWKNKSTGQNIIWFMNGAAYSSYTYVLSVTDLNWQIVGTGDFNSDGKTDILWRHKTTGQNALWFMNGATYSDYAYINSVTDLNWQIVGTGDFNSDGKTDILWRHKTTGQNALWFMNGATYSDYAYINSVTDLNWEIVGTGDFNSDGKTDILWKNKSTGQNTIWFMNGAAYSSYTYVLSVTDLNWQIVGPK